MNVFEAAKRIETHVKNIVNENTIQMNGVCAINNEGTILKFNCASKACADVGSSGWVFSWRYKGGEVEITPEG